MDEARREFRRWDRTGTLEFKESKYGRDVLNKLIDEILADDKGRYRIGWCEKERVMQRSDGSTKAVAVLFLTIEMCKPNQKNKYIPL